MTRRYSAFMVRCWHLANGQHRYEIQEIQTGAVVRVHTLTEACNWLDSRSGHQIAISDVAMHLAADQPPPIGTIPPHRTTTELG